MMSARGRSRFGLALLAGSVFYAVTLAASSHLPGPAPVPAGTRVDRPACHRDRVALRYVTAFVAGHGYDITAVELSGVGPGCAEGQAEVTLSDGSGAVLARGSGPAAVGADGTVTLPLTEGVPAGAVARTDVVFT